MADAISISLGGPSVSALGRRSASGLCSAEVTIGTDADMTTWNLFREPLTQAMAILLTAFRYSSAPTFGNTGTTELASALPPVQITKWVNTRSFTSGESFLNSMTIATTGS